MTFTNSEVNMEGAITVDNILDKIRSQRCKIRFKLVSDLKKSFGDQFDNLDFLNYETGDFVKGSVIRDAKCGCEIYERLGWERSDFGKAGIHGCGCKVYNEKIRAINASSSQPLENIPYYVEAEDGKSYSGYTSTDGTLPRIFTQNDHEITVYWYDEALAKMEDINAEADY
jgi:hypothetical protein